MTLFGPEALASLSWRLEKQPHNVTSSSLHCISSPDRWHHSSPAPSSSRHCRRTSFDIIIHHLPLLTLFICSHSAPSSFRYNRCVISRRISRCQDLLYQVGNKRRKEMEK
ncbi:unnamed protein product [Linum trigynum]|uniref:Uncharacterized protein n=1 Tax=Linum trigynum TaxID=586398 RepID=A0AAV2GAD3_9ROSI